MKYFFLFLVVSFFPTMLMSQVSQSYDCFKYDKMFFKVETLPKFGKSSEDLESYFDSSFKKMNYLFDARILVQINLDSTGTPCCSNILKSLGGDVDFQKIRNTIYNMPKWIPAKQNGHDVNYTFGIVLFYQNNKLNVLHGNTD